MIKNSLKLIRSVNGDRKEGIQRLSGDYHVIRYLYNYIT